MRPADACPICGCGELEIEFELPDVWYGVNDEVYRMRRCARCSVSSLSPRPAEAEIGRLYPRDYYSASGDLLTNALPYLRRRFALLPNVPGRVLDIGAQKGEFLEICRRGGWEVIGVEIDPAIPNPYEVPMRYGPVGEMEFEEESFDTITLWHVFEHLSEPRRTLWKIHSWLKPGGRIVMALPNSDSLLRRVMHIEDVPRHLFAYNEAGLGNLLVEAGFRMMNTTYRNDVHEQIESGLVSFILQKYLFRTTELELLRRYYNDPASYEGVLLKMIDRPVTRTLAAILPWLKRSRNFCAVAAK